MAARGGVLVVLVAVGVGVPGAATAGGLYVPDVGVEPQGRGGAFAAKADSYLALHYNPGGLTQMKGFHIQGGLMAHGMWTVFQRSGGEANWKPGITYNEYGQITDDTAYREGFAAVSNQDGFRPVPELALVYGLERPALTFAFGLYAPNAPWQTYPEDGAQRYRITRSRLDQGNFTLGLAWQPWPFLSVGAALQLVYIGLEDDFYAYSYVYSLADSTTLFGRTETGPRNEEDTQYDLKVHFEARQFPALGGNFGVLLRPVEALRVGIGFQTPIHMKAPGLARMSGSLGAEAFGFAHSMGLVGVDQVDVDGTDEELLVETDLPAILRWGVLVRPHARFEFEVDGVVEFWKAVDGITATQVDVPLTAGPEAQPLGEYLADPDGANACGVLVQKDGKGGCADVISEYRGTDGQGTFSLPQEHENTLSLRLGVEANPVDPLVIRAGYLFESDGTPDSGMNLLAIDGVKHGVGGGLALRLPGFELGGSFLHIFYGRRTITAEESEGRQTVAIDYETDAAHGGADFAHTIDAGTYRAGVNNVGFYVKVAPQAIAAARRQGR